MSSLILLDYFTQTGINKVVLKFNHFLKKKSKNWPVEFAVIVNVAISMDKKLLEKRDKLLKITFIDVEAINFRQKIIADKETDNNKIVDNPPQVVLYFHFSFDCFKLKR